VAEGVFEDAASQRASVGVLEREKDHADGHVARIG
jgi:hypothetical protein